MLDSLSQLFLATDNPSVLQSLIVLLLTICSGVFLGRTKIANVSLGVSGVLFTGLLLGHLGYRISGDLSDFTRDFGLILFVYAIGLQVGPSFFSSFKSEGLKYNLLALFGVLMGAGMTLLLFRSTSLSIENLVGIMSGAVTNTPGLGAAKSTIDELKASGLSGPFSDPAIGYAIAYPIGVLGIILTLILSKSLLKINPENELKKFRLEKIHTEMPVESLKIRVLKEEVIGKTLEEVLHETLGKVVVSRLKHSGSTMVSSPTLDTPLEMRDVLLLVGYKEDLLLLEKKLGRVSTDSFIESGSNIKAKNFFVTRNSAMHKTLMALDLYNQYDLQVTRVFRAGKELLARPSLELFYGDKIRIVGSAENLKLAEKLIGNSEKKLLEPDFLSLFAGLLIGILVGSIPMLLPGMAVPLKLGLAAGPLLIALLISRFGGVAFIHSFLHVGAIHFMKDLGITLFFASVGVHAGAHFYSNFLENNGWLWLGYGALITFVPLLLMVIIGHFILKINFLALSGILSGSYTDPAALSFSTSYLDSDIPLQSYAQVYPLVTFFRIFIAQLLILLFLSS